MMLSFKLMLMAGALVGQMAGQMGAAPGKPASADDLSWLAGYWLTCEGGREVSETWSDARSGQLVGHGVTISTKSGAAKSGFEMFRIAGSGDQLTYFAQPEGIAPVPFRATEVGPDHAVFSNPDNDFPQRILYRRAGDALTARIEGEINGQTRDLEWRYLKSELNSHCPS